MTHLRIGRERSETAVSLGASATRGSGVVYLTRGHPPACCTDPRGSRVCLCGEGHRASRRGEPFGRHVAVDRLILPRAHLECLVPDTRGRRVLRRAHPLAPRLCVQVLRVTSERREML